MQSARPVLFSGVLLLLTASAPLVGQAPDKTKSLEGSWLGTIKAGGAELRLVLHLKGKSDDLTGTFDSLDQGAKGLKLDDVSLKDGTLRFELKLAKASYEGKLNADAT